jgi:hypothetical protein
MLTLDKPRASQDVSEIDRNALNAAFAELDLCWCWDSETYRELMAFGSERERLLEYLRRQQRHLLSAYDPDFLVGAILEAKRHYYDELIGAPEH